MIGRRLGLVLAFGLGWLGGNAGAASTTVYRDAFPVDRARLGAAGLNPYFPLEPGVVLTLASPDGKARLTISVLAATRLVDGVATRVVLEDEPTEGPAGERSENYFAIDAATHDVYYFGENAGGAWLSGVGGARFGLMFPGSPKVGDRFAQEIAPKVAMDRAEIVSLDETVVTPAGTFTHCLKVAETSALEQGDREFKWYAPGVGLVKEGAMVLVRADGLPRPTRPTHPDKED